MNNIAEDSQNLLELSGHEDCMENSHLFNVTMPLTMIWHNEFHFIIIIQM